MFQREREAVQRATEVVRDNSTVLLIATGVAVAIAVVALVVAVNAKVSK
jgi:hypothetical protein